MFGKTYCEYIHNKLLLIPLLNFDSKNPINYDFIYLRVFYIYTFRYYINYASLNVNQ
jgi:hypothetical protein